MKSSDMRKVNFDGAAAVLASRPDVIAAWAFGSAKDGYLRPGGDVDIAVLFERKADLDIILEVIGQLQKALGCENLDLTPINEDSPSILRFEAISGNRIACRDPGRTAAFVSLTCREYEEDMALIDQGNRWRREIRQRAEIL